MGAIPAGQSTSFGAEASAISPEQEQPGDDEGAIDSFIAVNDRASSGSQPAKHVSMQPVQDRVSLGAHRNHGEPISGIEQFYGDTHTNDSSGCPMISSSNGMLTRKRSVVVADDDYSSGDNSCNLRSPPTASLDAHIQDSSASLHAGAEQHEHSWTGHTQDEQVEHLHMLTPIQRENQQQQSNGNFTPMTPLQYGHSICPGYHIDENKGIITTNAGVQMNFTKRKRVGSLTISLHIWSSEIY